MAVPWLMQDTLNKVSDAEHDLRKMPRQRSLLFGIDDSDSILSNLHCLFLSARMPLYNLLYGIRPTHVRGSEIASIRKYGGRDRIPQRSKIE